MFIWHKCSNNANKIEVTHDMVVLKIEEMGKLEVVKYNMQNIVEYKKMRQWLPNAKTALVAVGEVVGCIDLSLITADDVTVTGDSVHIVLPSPEVCYSKVDHKRSRVYDVNFGWWDTANLVDDAYRFAENQLYLEAINMGIISESKRNAVKILTPLINALGYKKAGFDFKQPDINENQPLFKDYRGLNVE